MDRREFLRFGAVGLGVSTLVGASGLNPLAPSRDDSGTGTSLQETPTPGSAGTPTPEPAPSFQLWSHDVRGSVSGFTAAPDASDVFVVIGNSVSRLDAESGEHIWQARSEQSIEAPVAVGDDSVFAAGRHGRLLAIDRGNGDRRWFENTRSFSPNQPVIHNETVLLPGRRIYAFDQESGDREWVSSARFTSPVTLRTDEYLYVGDSNDAAKLRLDDGSAVWTWEDRRSTADLAFNLVASQDHELLFGTNGGRLYAVDTSNGEPLWQAEDPGLFQSLVLQGDSLLYLITTDKDNSQLGAIDLTGEEIRWEKIAPLDIDGWDYGTVSTELTIYEGDLLAGTSTGHLVRLDPDDGTLRDAASVLERAIEWMALDQARTYVAGDDRIFGIDLSEVFTDS